jgi:general secretion pathway protein A
MNLKETMAYIAYRLEKSGGSSTLFPRDVIEKIFEVSAGIPRTINLLCDAALVYGYADGIKTISLDILKQVIEDKGGMGVFTKQKLNNMPKNTQKDDPSEQLKEKIAKMEQRIEKLTTDLDGKLIEAEYRSKFCRDELVSNLVNLLKAEKKRNSLLEYEYGRIKGRNEFAARLKRIK